MDDSSDDFIDCYGVGDPIHVDAQSHVKYYVRLLVKDVEVFVGDCVRVKMDSDVDEQAFGQVLAIFEDSEEYMFVEIRWFKVKRELDAKVIRIYNKLSPLENELIETDELDDIHAGSILEVIHIASYKNPMRQDSAPPGEATFQCRYLLSSEINSLQNIHADSMFTRGREYSLVDAPYDNDNEHFASCDPFTRAIRNLHISYIPSTLPCRSLQQKEITSFIRSGLETIDFIAPMFISGLPGCGKTATVIASVRSFDVPKGSPKPFEYVEINCMRIKKPEDTYTLLWAAISQRKCSYAAALKQLQEYFKPDYSRNAISKEKVVCLVDEMEYLVKSKKVIYNLLEFARVPRGGLILLCVANALDLADMFQNSADSRIQEKISRLPFPSYSHTEMSEILADRIARSVDSEAIDPKIATICAKQTAAFTGDIRTALKILQRALEMLREDWKKRSSTDEKPSFSQLVHLVKKVADKYRESPSVALLQSASRLEQAIMIAVCKHIKATGGSADMTLEMIWDRVNDLQAWFKQTTGRPPFTPPPRQIYFDAITRLMQQGFLHESNTKAIQFISPRYSENYVSHGHDKMFHCRLEYGDITGALREVNGEPHEFYAYVA